MSLYTHIEARTRYQTEDGGWWDSEAEAEAWHRNLRERQTMNEMLDAGATLGAIAQRFPGWQHRAVSGGIYGLPANLADVTARHAFVIGHWQCNDNPVYFVRHFNPNGSVYVSGVGGWRGSYGSEVDWGDLSRYAAQHPPVVRQEVNP